jgi:DNA polymerase-3 subunit beta
MTQKRTRLSRKASDTSTPTTSAPSPHELTAIVEIAAPRKAWIAAIKTLDKVADPKSHAPVLGCVLIRVTCDEILLAATDLSTYAMIRPTDWTIRGVGDAAIPANALSKALATMPDGEITVVGNVTNGAYVATVRSSSGITATIAAMSPRDYPHLATVPATLATLPAEPIRAMLAATLPTVCKDATRFHLNGVHVEMQGETMVMVSTDGHRLTKVQRDLGPTMLGALPGVIVPTDACKALAPLIKRADSLEFGLNASGAPVFRVGNVTIASKAIDAKFPPYEQVIPKDSRVLVTVDREALVGAVTRAKVACSSTRGMEIRLTEDGIKLAASNGNGLEVRESLPAELNAANAGFRIGCNPTYLLDALDLDADRVTLTFSGAVCKPSKDAPDPSGLDPFLVRATLDQVSHALPESRRVGVLMPMRI